jgi:hypothetical protein
MSWRRVNANSACSATPITTHIYGVSRGGTTRIFFELFEKWGKASRALRPHCHSAFKLGAKFVVSPGLHWAHLARTERRPAIRWHEVGPSVLYPLSYEGRDASLPDRLEPATSKADANPLRHFADARVRWARRSRNGQHFARVSGEEARARAVTLSAELLGPGAFPQCL